METVHWTSSDSPRGFFNEPTSFVHVMLNGGTYGPAVTMEVNRFAADLAIADVDADGELDLIISSGQSVLNGFPIEARIEVLRGVGDGTFEAPRAYGHRTIGHYKDIVVDDLNGDGMPDLVVAISNDVWPGGLGVLVNNGLGGFHEAKVYDPTASPVEGIATADFNGDGRPDILTANGFRSTFSILVGDVGQIAPCGRQPSRPLPQWIRRSLPSTNKRAPHVMQRSIPTFCRCSFRKPSRAGHMSAGLRKLPVG